jgi:hypothetical protein
MVRSQPLLSLKEAHWKEETAKVKKFLIEGHVAEDFEDVPLENFEKFTLLHAGDSSHRPSDGQFDSPELRAKAGPSLRVGKSPSPQLKTQGEEQPEAGIAEVERRAKKQTLANPKNRTKQERFLPVPEEGF